MDLPLGWVSASSLLSRTSGGGCFRSVVLALLGKDIEAAGSTAVAAVVDLDASVLGPAWPGF
jgi:hypothetical protein